MFNRCHPTNRTPSSGIAVTESFTISKGWDSPDETRARKSFCDHAHDMELGSGLPNHDQTDLTHAL